jgi:hypothetical protein
MRLSNNDVDLLFAGDQAAFSPELACVWCALDEGEFTIGNFLHEISHVITFVGTKHYARYAKNKLLGKPADVSQRDILRLCEAVPSVFKKFGGRHSPGSASQGDLVDMIVRAVNAYRDRFALPAKYLDMLEQAGAAAVAGISRREVFNRTIALTLVQAALDVGGNPDTTINEFYKKITNSKIVVNSTDSIEQCLLRVLGLYGDRIIMDWFRPQFDFLQVIRDADEATIAKNIMLLPAVIRLELIGIWSEDYFEMTFFAHNTQDGLQRLKRWLENTGGDPHRPSARENVSQLGVALLVPSYRERPLLPELGFEKDPAINMIWRLYGIRSMVLGFPHFFGWFVENDLGGSEVSKRLCNIINENTVDELLQNYFTRIANQARLRSGISSRLNLLTAWPYHHRLRNGPHPEYGASWFITPDRG